MYLLLEIHEIEDVPKKILFVDLLMHYVNQRSAFKERKSGRERKREPYKRYQKCRISTCYIINHTLDEVHGSRQYQFFHMLQMKQMLRRNWHESFGPGNRMNKFSI